MRYIEDIQQIQVDLTRDDGDILVVCSLLDKLCFLMVDWVGEDEARGKKIFTSRAFLFRPDNPCTSKIFK